MKTLQLPNLVRATPHRWARPSKQSSDRGSLPLLKACPTRVEAEVFPILRPGCFRFYRVAAERCSLSELLRLAYRGRESGRGGNRLRPRRKGGAQGWALLSERRGKFPSV